MIIFVCSILSLVASQDYRVKVTYLNKSYSLELCDLTVSKLQSAFNISEFEYLEDLSGKTFYPSLDGTFSTQISSEVFVRQLCPNSIPTAIYPTEAKFMHYNGNWNPAWDFDIGCSGGTSVQRIGYLQFKDLSLINKKKKISKVYLRLIGTWQQTTLPVEIFIHECETDWLGIISWSQQPAYREEPYSSRIVTENRGVRYNWDVTGIVTNWVAGIHPNYGIAVKTNNTWGLATVKGFYVNEPIKKPCLLVYYSE